jgi:hypothetical protein
MAIVNAEEFVAALDNPLITEDSDAMIRLCGDHIEFLCNEIDQLREENERLHDLLGS